MQVEFLQNYPANSQLSPWNGQAVSWGQPNNHGRKHEWLVINLTLKHRDWKEEPLVASILQKWIKVMQSSGGRPRVHPKALVGGISPFFYSCSSVTTLQGKFRFKRQSTHLYLWLPAILSNLLCKMTAWDSSSLSPVTKQRSPRQATSNKS